MKKPLKIINIDGTEGAGKTSQVHMLNLLLRSNEVPTLVLYLDDTIESGLSCTTKIKEFLQKEPDGVVISDGSVARMMVMDLIAGVGKNDMATKYQELLHEYQTIAHQYGTANILMVMNDITECSRRVKRRAELLGEDSKGIVDFNLEADVVKGMQFFDDHIISKSLKFQVFNIENFESIIDVHDSLCEYLEENFEVDMKKPEM